MNVSLLTVESGGPGSAKLESVVSGMLPAVLVIVLSETTVPGSVMLESVVVDPLSAVVVDDRLLAVAVVTLPASTVKMLSDAMVDIMLPAVGDPARVSYRAVVVLSTRPLNPKLTTLPSARVMPSCRQVSVVPSTTAKPVVPGTAEAVTVVRLSGRMATAPDAAPEVVGRAVEIV